MYVKHVDVLKVVFIAPMFLLQKKNKWKEKLLLF